MKKLIFSRYAESIAPVIRNNGFCTEKRMKKRQKTTEKREKWAIEENTRSGSDFYRFLGAFGSHLASQGRSWVPPGAP